MFAVSSFLTGARDANESTMNPTGHHLPRWAAALLAISLVVGACSSDSGDDANEPSDEVPPARAEEGSITVLPDYESDVFVVNVYLDEGGFEPGTIRVPAGRHVKLVLRNRGRYEHHYRVVGLVASEIRWLQIPDIDEDELLAAEMEGGFVGDIEHVLHHLTPEFVPFKPESRSGIRVLPTEVHGYAHGGDHDVLFFYPLNTGSFRVEDVLYPEITGKVVVFDASKYLAAEPDPEA
jgi:hypothetical protein